MMCCGVSELSKTTRRHVGGLDVNKNELKCGTPNILVLRLLAVRVFQPVYCTYNSLQA